LSFFAMWVDRFLTPGTLSIWVLEIAALLDFLIGDPRHWWHPVQGMGWLIERYTQICFKRLNQPLALRWAGVGLGLGLIGGCGLFGWAIVTISQALHPLLRIGVESVLVASCLAGRSLRDAAMDVLHPLQQGDLVDARSRLSHYVGRDTEQLSEAEILRAVLETVTENATDGVLAPLFWALVGAGVGVGSLPLALAYKASSTLDSMVGYRTPPYTDMGWFSANADDWLTWLPCRCVVLTLGLLSGRPWRVWQLCRRDAPQDPSPNSGWSECVYAAILGVQVGGQNRYRGVVKDKPRMGDATHAIAPADIHAALRLTRSCFLLWLVGWLMLYWGRWVGSVSAG
jgi:adenosylcobinamide-phosphate synthase